MAKQNTHLEHLEDDILNQGSNGGRNAIAFLRELGKMLSEPDSGIRITTKWDGAPAVICGQHPETKDFFVGTKGVFAKTPKICMSDKDVDLLYKGELANKLKTCLRELPKLGITGVVQGDLLFTKGDVKTHKVNGEVCNIFQPNTITYAVPQKSEIGKKVANANIGIVFHTRYTGGPELRDMTASFGVNVNAFKKVNSVAVFSSNFTDTTGASTFTDKQKRDYDAAVNKAEGSLKQASKFLDVLKQTGDGKFLLSAMFKVYFNTYIRRGVSMSSAQQVALGFAAYYKSALDKEISTKKTESTKNKYCLLYASPSPRDATLSRMPSSA